MRAAKLELLTDDQKRMQMDLLHESELTSMQREYNILERDARNRTQFSGLTKLAKSNRVISLFRQEHDNILTDLSVAASESYKRADAKRFDYLSGLLDENTYFEERLNTKKTYMEELNGQIKQVAKSVQQLHQMQITDRQFEDRVCEARATVAALENKLEVQMKKFNVICAKNTQLRMEIDHLLWERRNFLTMWNKFINKISSGKKIMLDLIEQATIAYDQREEWCSKLQLLRIKAHNDLYVNIQDIRALKGKGDNAKKLEEFFNTKGQKRIAKDLGEMERLKRIELKEKLKVKLEKYEAMMADIREFTKESEIKVMATKFYNDEAENFMNFKYVNDMISEMESVNDYLGLLHLHIDERQLLNLNRAYQQQTTLDTLEEKLEKTTDDTQDVQNKLDQVDAKLQTMMQGISSLVNLCRCDKDPLLQLLGDNSKIEHYNVLLYLRLLEKKIHECLIQAGYKDRIMMGDRKKDASFQRILYEDPTRPKVYLTDRVSGPSPCALCVEHDMVSDVYDSTQCVYSRKLAKIKVQQGAEQLETMGLMSRLHNISDCYLPKARQVIQKRYE